MLRQAYDDAFRQFSLQVRLLQSFASHPAPHGGAIEEANRRLARAHLVYRERRDALAQFLLTTAPKGAAASLAHRVQVERAAYRLWEEAGRPSGRAEEHWYLAERLLHSAA